MKIQSMTALVSAFVRAYHAEEAQTPVFRDTMAKRLLGAPEYARLCVEWTAAAAVFAPDFAGTEEQALKCTVNRVLAGAPLARSAFAEERLEEAVRQGAAQYLLFGAGYDTFAYRRPAWAARLSVWEIDRAETLRDKQSRLAREGILLSAQTVHLAADLSGDWTDRLTVQPAFDRQAYSVCSLLGLSYYLQESAFAALLRTLHELLPHARLVFDYPQTEDSANAIAALAAEAGETMRSAYTPQTMRRLLTDCGWRVQTMLASEEIERRYFTAYNAKNPETPIKLAQRIGLCCAENG